MNGALFHLVEFFAIALTATALLASLSRYGSFRWRFRRLLGPWALVQPAIAVAGILAAIGSPLVQVHIGDINIPILYGPLSTVGVLLVVCVLSLTQSALAVGAYRFLYNETLILLASITWVLTYFGYHALTIWLAYILRIGA